MTPNASSDGSAGADAGVDGSIGGSSGTTGDGGSGVGGVGGGGTGGTSDAATGGTSDAAMGGTSDAATGGTGGATGGSGGATGGSGGATSDPPDSNCTSATYGGHEYWFCTINRDWDEARGRCQAVGGDLVSIDDANEQAFIEANTDLGPWLIGINKKNASGTSTVGTWEWVDGTSPLVYENWNIGEPGSLDCGGMNIDGTWNDFTCTNDENWICEVPGR